MKKVKKGLVLLSAGLVLMAAGCSCANTETPEQPTQENYQDDKNYEEYSKSLQGLYENSVKSTVAVYAYALGSEKPAIGTGVVYKQEGNYAYIMTNAHVLVSKSGDAVTEHINKIEVVYSNMVRSSADFISYDRNEDVAVIRVASSNNYTIATIVANDYETTVGEAVYAIGNPNNHLFSMTDGIIAATKLKTSIANGLSLTGKETFVYNTTATINPGNSGGPLFNAQGEVVAINTMYPADTAANRNYNYSIPARHFLEVADHIIKNGKNSYKRATLGLTGKAICCDYTVQQTATNSITIKNGIYVTSSTYANVPANSSVITAIGDVEVNTIEDLEYALFTKYANATSVQLTIKDRSGVARGIETVSLIRS